jgi:hypothetical protein
MRDLCVEMFELKSLARFLSRSSLFVYFKRLPVAYQMFDVVWAPSGYFFPNVFLIHSYTQQMW